MNVMNVVSACAVRLMETNPNPQRSSSTAKLAFHTWDSSAVLCMRSMQLKARLMRMMLLPQLNIDQ